MSVAQWVLIGVLVLLIFAYPFIMRSKSKKENEKLIEQTNSLKRGDKILTTSGVYGTIIEVREEDGAKKVVIETGNDKYKSYMSIDAYAIYTVLKDDVKPQEKVEIKEEKVEPKEEKKEDNKEEVKTEEKKEETKKAKATKTTNSTKKTTSKAKTTKKD